MTHTFPSSHPRPRPGINPQTPPIKHKTQAPKNLTSISLDNREQASMRSSTDSDAGTKAHILVLPYPAQGHMLPLLALTHHLALRGDLSLTVIVTPSNLPLLDPLLSAHPTSVRPLVLPFPSHPPLPPGVEHVSRLGNASNPPIVAALSRLSAPIAAWSRSLPSPPRAIVSDFFLGWTHRLAADLAVPLLSFFSTSAFFVAVNHSLWRRFARPPPPRAVVQFPDLPRAPSFKEEHLPTLFRLYRESDPDMEIVRDGILANSSASGCILNTFHALEPDYIQVLKEQGFASGRVYVVGPHSLMMGRPDPHPELTSSNAALMAWLDGCPDGSVLYACFGSQKLLKKSCVEALSSGLERSGSRFVWVVKPATPEQLADGYGAVPDGFEGGVEGRGLVVRGWAPQARVLSHRAVGGFLSHCGWNSVLEGIAAGVVILGWPMEADQFLNARELVEEMGVGVRVWEGEDSVPNSAELGRRIQEGMRGDIPQRGRAKEMREKALAAVGSGGSSMRDFDDLLKELTQL